MFKDVLSSTCQVSVGRIVLDLGSEAAWVLFPLEVTFCHWIFLCFHAVFTENSIRFFLQTHKTGNIGIIGNFVFPNNWGFPVYLEHLMLVSMKLDIIGCN